MPLAPERKVYDVCIVGSGAGGGMAAYALTKAGARRRRCSRPAGRGTPSKDSKMMLTMPYASPRRGASTKTRPFGEFDACDRRLGDRRRAVHHARPARSFDWWRARMLGGRTNHWGRISLRFGPDDFRGKSLDGLGDDWPISYDDVAPYYDQRRPAHRHLRQQGRNLPNEPDGIFQPPPKPRCYELLVKKASRQAEHHVHSGAALDHHASRCNGRQACHYCGQCNRGCTVKANFSSPDVLIAPALADRQAHADHERDGARSDRRTATVSRPACRTSTRRPATDEHVRAQVVVLAASALRVGATAAQLEVVAVSRKGSPTRAAPSASTSPTPPAPTSSGFIPAMVDHVPHNEDGVGGMHVYMPWWLDNKKLDFPRGYHIEVWRRARAAGVGFMGGIQRYPQRRRLRQAAQGRLSPLLRRDDRILRPRRDDPERRLATARSIPNVVDQFGIPVLRFHWKWSDHEYNQVKHMQETFRALIAEMGGTSFGADADEGAGLRHRRPAARSSTSWAARAWATTRRRRS